MRGCGLGDKPPVDELLRPLERARQENLTYRRIIFDDASMGSEGSVKSRAMSARGTNTEDSLSASGVWGSREGETHAFEVTCYNHCIGSIYSHRV